MPRDLEQQTALAPAPDLTRPSLEGARWLALHPELWPAGWTWDFSQEGYNWKDGNPANHEPVCGTIGCLFGICQRIWGFQPPQGENRGAWATDRRVARMFRISLIDAYEIFVRDLDDESITPGDVADRITKYLEFPHES